MTPLRDYIFFEYTPERLQEVTESGIVAYGEDYNNFIEVIAKHVGMECKEVVEGDTLYIRKESLFQTSDDINSCFFLTKENLVLKINGHPAGKYVVLTNKKEEVTQGGIILPYKEGEFYVATSIGTECEDVRVGDLVVIDEHSGIKDGKELIVSEGEISVIIE